MEHTVPLTVTLRTEHADLGSLERAIDGALAEAGRALWAELRRVLEAALPSPTACPCGGTLKANGPRVAWSPWPARSTCAAAAFAVEPAVRRSSPSTLCSDSSRASSTAWASASERSGW